MTSTPDAKNGNPGSFKVFRGYPLPRSDLYSLDYLYSRLGSQLSKSCCLPAMLILKLAFISAKVSRV